MGQAKLAQMGQFYVAVYMSDGRVADTLRRGVLANECLIVGERSEH